MLAVEIKEDNVFVKNLMETIKDEKAYIQMKGERSFLKALNGSCHIPVGAYCELKDQVAIIHGLYGKEDGSALVRQSIEGPIEEVENLGIALAQSCHGQVHQTKGRVYLAGGGCGDPGLITVKAMEMLKKADVVVYDALVNPSFLKEARPDAEIIYVGKRAANHAMAQEEINALLIDKALKEKLVIRLKGGDPYVFGRGGEEGQELYDAGIPFEVIPGITSAIGGLAYAGIPITHRDANSSFHVITGHLKADSTDLDWPVLAKLKGTLVFLMGVKNLKRICQALIKNGMDPKMPAALVHRASTPDQRTVVGDLETITGLATAAGIKAPSLIVVGEVVAKREKLNFFEEKPLFGQTIIVTRSRAQSSEMSAQIRALGGKPIEYPTIKIVAINEEACDDKVRHMSAYSHIIFTSINGVEVFFASMKRCGKDARIFAGLHITVIGEGTRKALGERGLEADFVPKKYIGEELVEGLSPLLDKESKVLLPRSKNARIYIAEQLSKICQVDEVHTYETIREDDEGSDVVSLLEQNKVDYLTFTSSTTVAYFLEKVGRDHLEAINRAKTISIGPQTSQKARELGIVVNVEAKDYTIAGMIKAMLDDHKNKETKEKEDVTNTLT